MLTGKYCYQTRNRPMKRLSLILLTLLLKSIIYCQTESLNTLNEVKVNSYFSARPVLRLATSVSVIDTTLLKKQTGLSFVPVMNSVPGVRMEERSPGSYRLSIRGSLLRSPYGIRNVKIYLDDFPLTDAGGNTYLNLIDISTIRSVEVLKGPDGTLFGPNSGGVIRLNSLPADTITQVKAGILTGSYGLFNETASFQHHIRKNTFHIIESWQRSDGYRENSKFDRKYIQLCDQFRYHKNALLTLLLFYSNLKYQTPGGLTLTEWMDDPAQARPATKHTPGVIDQHTGVSNATWFGGLTHTMNLGNYWKHNISVLASSTDFENPFITNYEVRKERAFGTRTWFEASNNQEGDILLKFHAGMEFLQTNSDIKNYKNNFGKPGPPVKFDKISAVQSFVFNNFTIDLKNKWLLEAGLSFNFYEYLFSTSFPYGIPVNERTFKPQWMPKFAVSYQLSSLVAWRAIVSKGYSPPTVPEIRSSNNEVNTNLQPENGWNYETGVRWRTKDNMLWWDASIFYYQLQQAIVRRLDTLGNDYFVNAGGTKQLGIESQLTIQLIRKRNAKFIRGLELNNSFTYSNFHFFNYSNGVTNYSGNKVTGVPSTVIVTGLTTAFPFRSEVYLQYYYGASLFLNDANTVSANAYSLFMLKAGSTLIKTHHFSLHLSAGIDNLLNEKYSQGNDLNAMGERYYNAAMPRNFFCKVEVSL